MLVSSDDVGVFPVYLTYAETQGFLMDADVQLTDVNRALDLAASHAKDHDRAYVLIKIIKES